MEARQTLTGGFVRKRERMALAIFAALALAGAGAVITKDLGGTGGSAQPVVHPAPGTVLRQDNPVQPVVHPAPGTTTDIHRPFVVEQPPYSSPAASQQCVWAGTPPNRAC